MIFGPGMLKKVLSGEKTVTRRRTSHYAVGKVYAVQPGRGKRHVAHIKAVSVWDECLGGISYASAQAEGFESPAAFKVYWTALHGGWNPREVVTRIVFELASPCPRCPQLPSTGKGT